MYNITLICTRHKDNGKCNSKELYDIIVKINPEIIFEEIPCFWWIKNYKEQSDSILEIKAIEKYLEKHEVEQIPVDNLDLLKQLNNFEYRKEQKICNNSVWRDLLEKQCSLEYQHGFMYLNNTQCDDFFEKLSILEEYIIKNSNKEKLFRLYNSWHEIQGKREYEMINNIYKYSYKNVYNKALFLVGSGHRKSIINKAQEYNIKAEIKLNWNFNL